MSTRLEKSRMSLIGYSRPEYHQNSLYQHSQLKAKRQSQRDSKISILTESNLDFRRIGIAST